MMEHDDWNWKITYKSLIDEKELLSLQKHFCSASGLCAGCVDAYGKMRTEFTGDKEDLDRLRSIVTDRQIEEALKRVKEGSLEELVVEDTELPYVKYAVLSVRVKGRVMINWVLLGILNDTEGEPGVPAGCHNALSEMNFYKDIDLLMVCSRLIFENKCRTLLADEPTGKMQETTLKKDRQDEIAALTELLDSEDAVEVIMAKFLQITVSTLKLSGGFVCHMDRKERTADILAQWYGRGNVSPFEKTRGIPAEDILFTKEPLIVDSDSIQGIPEAEKWYRDGVRAFLLYPLMENEESSMCLSLCQLNEERYFDGGEVRFISGAVKILQSILGKRIQKNSLSCAYVSMESVLDGMKCGIYIREPESGQVLFSNKLLQNAFAKELEAGTFEELLTQKLPFRYETAPKTDEEGEACSWFDLAVSDVTWVDGRKVQMYAVYDVTDRKVYQKKVEQQIYTDFLTGLYNRICCERDLAVYVDNAGEKQKKGALLYLDLDDFKHINDGLGHQYGDMLLKQISRELKKIKGIGQNCYRVGGDEFIIIIPPEEYGEYDRILSDIQDIFLRPWNLKDMDYYCTMSMGVVEYPQNGQGIQDLIKKADIAMFEAKKNGKNRVIRYEDGLDSESGRRLTMEKNMRDATVAGYKEFEIYYQPIMDISRPGAPCTGAEALLRWNSASLGFISPADFIPLAEYLGLINPIGHHVLVEACRECRRWNENGHPEYKVSVNLSVVQLLQPDIVESVERVLDETGISPKNLTLEVTESLAINDMNRMKEILGNIRKLGVRIALDDFGTGYSSLNHIRELPFDVIKVDQSFVKDLAEDAYSQSFIKMVAELAQTIGVNICVEGIETKEQYRLLGDMKVRMVQGYYFARPLKREVFEADYVPELAEKKETQPSAKLLAFPEKAT